MSAFISPGASCAATSECISGEGCNSAGVCGTYIYSIYFWNVYYTTKGLSYNRLYHIDGITLILNLDNSMSSDPSCSTVDDCISGEACTSDAICGRYIYWLAF